MLGNLFQTLRLNTTRLKEKELYHKMLRTEFGTEMEVNVFSVVQTRILNLTILFLFQKVELIPIEIFNCFVNLAIGLNLTVLVKIKPSIS